MTGYTPAEASVLTGLPLPAVRRALEDASIPSRKVRSGRTVQRMISSEGLLCLRLEQLGVGNLPLGHRRRIYRAVLAHPGAARVRDSEAVVIEVAKAKADLKTAMSSYKKAHAIIHSDPEIMGGDPVIRGSRLPAHYVAEMRRQGATVEELVEGYSSLTPEVIELCEVYDRAHPRRGRKKQFTLPKGARLIAHVTYPLSQSF